MSVSRKSNGQMQSIGSFGSRRSPSRAQSSLNAAKPLPNLNKIPFASKVGRPRVPIPKAPNPRAPS